MPKLHALLLILAVAADASDLLAQNDPAAALEGAWLRVGFNAADRPDQEAQPGVRLFVDGHYTRVFLTGTGPRPELPSPDATAEELRAVWDPVSAYAGRYEVSGQTLTEHWEVAKNPDQMEAGAFAKLAYRIAGDTLWLTLTETRSGAVADRPTGRYLRVRGTDAGALRGAWRHLEVRSPDGMLLQNQPGFRLFVDGFYGWVRANGLAPRVQPAETATAEELRAAWGAAGFLAASGTYAVVGDVTIQSAVVGMDPQAMTPGRFSTFTYRVSGDTLISTNLGSQAGTQAVPNAGKYLRVLVRPRSD